MVGGRNLALAGKKIMLGVTGGIAAYKSAEIVRQLVKMGSEVRVAMTGNAAQFVSPLTFQTLSSKPVVSDMFAFEQAGDISHISLARWSDLLLVAPATANILGKYACGIADDFLSTFLLATTAPVMFAPAMNTQMYFHPSVQANLARIKAIGADIIEPEEGDLACKEEGIGRLASVERIIEAVVLRLKKTEQLAGKTVLVTAGPTREYLDSVRYLSNASSGLMGFAIARAALMRGAQVILLSGPTALTPPSGAKYIQVTSALEMRQAVNEHFTKADIVFKTAAVVDYRFSQRFNRKLKKEGKSLTLTLEPNPDILDELGRKKGEKVLVGFAAETDDIAANAKAKLAKKNLDMIVANDVSHPNCAMGSRQNKVLIIDRKGGHIDLPLMDKEELGEKLVDLLIKYIEGKRN